MKPIDDINYNIESKPYIELKEKILKLKKNKKKLLIKINSHFCAGKTTFIRRTKNYYRKFKLLDIDNMKRKEKNSSVLFKMKEDTVLIGYSGGAKSEELPIISKNCNNNMTVINWKNQYYANEYDIDIYDDIIYIFVFPRLKEFYRNIVIRQIMHSSCDKADNSKNLTSYRNNMYSKILKNNIQIRPLFYSFKEALDFCKDIYKNN